MLEINFGYVPTLDMGMVQLGIDEGIFEAHGIEVNLTPVDGGPAIISGIIAQEFDVGYVAYAPPLLAVAAGQPVQVVSNVALRGPPGANAEIIVSSESGITDFTGLSGKKLATNAPARSFP